MQIGECNLGKKEIQCNTDSPINADRVSKPKINVISLQ